MSMCVEDNITSHVSQVVRVPSNHERKGRFIVENLNHIHTVIVSDVCGLLSKAVASTSRDDKGYLSANVILEKRHGGSNANYSVLVQESSLTSSDALTNPDDVELCPHCIVVFASIDDASEALHTFADVENKMSTVWRSPVVMIAYKKNMTQHTDQLVVDKMRELSGHPAMFSFMEAAGFVGKKLIRHAIAVSLLASRPSVAAINSATDFAVIDEEEEQQPKRTRRSSLNEQLEKLHHKTKHHHGCRIH